jgi:GNAT superfamily N-acetyltransferase
MMFAATRKNVIFYLQWKDEFWGELGSDPDAGYIHTMAVKREYAGRGIGGELLKWADDYFEQGGGLRPGWIALRRTSGYVGSMTTWISRR